jgi:hypothetical protein
VARSIHLQSRRARRAFVSLNCGALPDTLLESELFGHKRGAFSGAIDSRVGLLEAASGGTLFLDELAEMSPAMQVRLLRVLDSGEVRRVGEERISHVDVRIVGATAKDLAREAAEGHFRWDLFYRLSTLVIPVPPLRRRQGDVPQLIEHFRTSQVRGGRSLRFTPEAMERLSEYGWPGNVRELRNLIERLQILHQGHDVGVADLPAEFGRAAPAALASPSPLATDNLMVPLAEVERRHVERVLHATGWEQGPRRPRARDRHQDAEQEDPRLHAGPARLTGETPSSWENLPGPVDVIRSNAANRWVTGATCMAPALPSISAMTADRPRSVDRRRAADVLEHAPAITPWQSRHRASPRRSRARSRARPSWWRSPGSAGGGRSARSGPPARCWPPWPKRERRSARRGGARSGAAGAAPRPRASACRPRSPRIARRPCWTGC